jgi:hypothetical protein
MHCTTFRPGPDVLVGEVGEVPKLDDESSKEMESEEDASRKV